MYLRSLKTTNKMSDLKRDIIIITGGSIDDTFACDFIKNLGNPYIIGADKGLLFLLRNGFVPDEILGDYDSVSRDDVKSFIDNDNIIKHEYRSEKDETDTQLAIIRATDLALEDKSFGNVHILGALGFRLDHILGSIHGLTYAYDRGIKVYIYDPHNKVYIAPKEHAIKKDTQYGNYVSFIPLNERVENLTLTGFKYNLENHTLTLQKSLAVSNEIVADVAHITYNTGYILCIEARE